MKSLFCRIGSDHNNRREKRRRLEDSGQTDEYEHNSTYSPLSLSNRVTATTSSNPTRRLSPSSTPSISLSSSEDEPALAIKSYRTNDDQTSPIQRPSSSGSLDQIHQRKRHQRKPTRGKPTPLHQSIAMPVKDEQCDTDDNSVTYSNSNDDNESIQKKKSGLLLSTGGNSSTELLNDQKASLGNSTTYKWLHQAFRSLIPPQSQSTDLELTMQQNSSSPQSSKQTTLFSIII